MKRQSGFSLLSMLVWGVMIGVVAIFIMKLVPSYIEYKTINKAVKNIADGTTPQSTVMQVRDAFTKQMMIDNVTTVTASDLDIYKEDNKVIIGFMYSQKLKLFGPVSLLIEYNGSSKTAD